MNWATFVVDQNLPIAGNLPNLWKCPYSIDWGRVKVTNVLVSWCISDIHSSLVYNMGLCRDFANSQQLVNFNTQQKVVHFIALGKSVTTITVMNHSSDWRLQLMKYLSVGLGLCCLMTLGLSKNIRCHVRSYLQIIRSHIRPHIKWDVILVMKYLNCQPFIDNQTLPKSHWMLLKLDHVSSEHK